MIDTFRKFVKSEQSGGLILIGCTVISLLLANSTYAEAYASIWDIKLGMSLLYWINDGLMAIFFLLVGLEIKREVTDGELSTPGQAAFPVAAALGGMLFPALIYFTLNKGYPSIDGWGIPMATDIAFALGIMMLMGNRVPVALKVFLVAVAVVDDLGAVMVIAVFYTSQINTVYLLIAAILLLLLIFMNRKGIDRLSPYLLIGAGLWFCFLMSGVHATIAGVLLALTIPTRKDHDASPLHILEHSLSTPVAVLIMPLFAMANTAIPLQADLMNQLTDPGGMGIIFGLVVGKPLGVMLFAVLVVRLNIASLPPGVSWGGVLSAGFFAGIGFTMSIFIANLAFAGDPDALETSKISIIAASVVSAISGMILLGITTTKKSSSEGMRGI